MSLITRFSFFLYKKGEDNFRHYTKFVGDTATKRIALKRIHILFHLARETISEDPELAQRYVEIARKIAMKTKVRLPREYKRQICRHCKSFVLPGVNCRVRIQPRREPHIVVTCLGCNKYTRLPLNDGRKQDHP